MRLIHDLILPLSLVLAGGSALGATIQVPIDQPTIAEAIAAATAGDTVLVAAGIYEVQDLAVPSGLTLRGDPDAPGGVTLQAAPASRAVSCLGVQGVVLENLVITGGRRLTGWTEDAGGGVRCVDAQVRIVNCRFTDNQASIGAGVALDGSTAIIERCTFDDNHASHAGWAAGGGVWSYESSGDVVDCTFTANTAFSVTAPGDGAGIFTERGGLTVRGCTFDANDTGAGGAAFYSYAQDTSRVVDCEFTANTSRWGAAVFLERSLATITRCNFIANAASHGAGAVETVAGNNVFRDCRFTDNTTASGTGGAIQTWGTTLLLEGCLFHANVSPETGGAVFMRGAVATLNDCVFSNNVALRGGALHCQLNSPQLVRCTFAGNQAASGGAAFHLESGAGASLDRCIIAFSPAGACFSGIGTTPVTLTCSNIFGNAAGDWVGAIADQLGQNGNLNVDPLFCDLTGGDVHLRGSSPCAEENNPECGQIGALPVGCPLVDVPQAAGAALTMQAPMPNPFNPSTTLRFTLGQAAWTTVDIFDVAGRRVRRLAAELMAPGDRDFAWDGRDGGGRLCPAGVYHAVVGSGSARAAVRLALVK